MLATITLSTHGKFLLLSGEVVWGVTELYTVAYGASASTVLNSLTEVALSNDLFSNNAGFGGAVKHSAGQFTAEFNYTTGEVNFKCSSLRVVASEVRAAPYRFLLCKVSPQSGAQEGSVLGAIDMDFTPLASVVSRPYMVSLPNDIVFSL